MARAPWSGGKTRLTPGLAPAEACALRAALLSDTLTVVRSTGMSCTVFFTPDDARDEMARLVGHDVVLEAQPPGDLGVRMHAAFLSLFDRGARHAVLIGSDMPSLPPAYVADAFARLAAGDDVVLGPAEDGGYYLIGLSATAWRDGTEAGRTWSDGTSVPSYGAVSGGRTRSDGTSVPSASLPRTLFEGMAWGGPDVLAGTRERALRSGLRVGLTGEWHDVDVPSDLTRVVTGAEPAPATRAWMTTYGATGRS